MLGMGICVLLLTPMSGACNCLTRSCQNGESLLLLRLLEGEKSTMTIESKARNLCDKLSGILKEWLKCLCCAVYFTFSDKVTLSPLAAYTEYLNDSNTTGRKLNTCAKSGHKVHALMQHGNGC